MQSTIYGRDRIKMEWMQGLGVMARVSNSM